MTPIELQDEIYLLRQRRVQAPRKDRAASVWILPEPLQVDHQRLVLRDTWSELAEPAVPVGEYLERDLAVDVVERQDPQLGVDRHADAGTHEAASGDEHLIDGGRDRVKRVVTVERRLGDLVERLVAQEKAGGHSTGVRDAERSLRQ